MSRIKLQIFLSFILTVSVLIGKTYVVAESGADYSSIQEALNVGIAGDTILVKAKSEPYYEKITFPRSGDETNGHIVLMAYPYESPIIDGTNYSTGGDWPQGLVRIINKNYIKVIGFEIRNIVVSDNDIFPAGIWVYGSSKNVEILNNKIHTIHQNANNAGAHGLAVYGTHNSIPISDILIDGNEISNCKLGWSESLVLNGNVENFIVSNNIIHDNNNIAYDFIGHEGECPNPELDQARNGLVVGNIAYNIDSRGNPAYGNEASADGFYVDGGKDIIFERNLVYNCNIGFEIASEHGGKSTSGIIIRNNLIRENIVLGLAIGGYDNQRGSADNCKILNNTLYKNNTENFNWGAEILVQYYCDNNLFANNIIYAKSNIPMVKHTSNTGSDNTFNNNLYFSEGTSLWKWGANSYSDIENYKTGSTEENESIFSDPKLVDVSNDNPNLSDDSPAREKGKNFDATLVGTTDYFGNPRVVNDKVDVGAVESSIVSSIESFGEKSYNDFYLFPAYPNPFNPKTVISYHLKNSSYVKLRVYDTLGRFVETLVSKQQKAGYYTSVWNAKNVNSGVYFAVLNQGANIISTRLQLVK